MLRERQTLCAAFRGACESHPEWVSLDKTIADTIIRRLERGCFNNAIVSCTRDGIDCAFDEPKFVARYSTECSRLILNLAHDSSVGSSHFVHGLIHGRFDPTTAVDLTSYDLCPEASEAERSDIELRLAQKTQLKVSRAYVCMRCNGNETIPVKYQARSADEDDNVSIKCVSCGNIWRK